VDQIPRAGLMCVSAHSPPQISTCLNCDACSSRQRSSAIVALRRKRNDKRDRSRPSCAFPIHDKASSTEKGSEKGKQQCNYGKDKRYHVNELPANFDIAAKGDRVWEDPCEGWRNDRFLERKRRRVGDHGASLGTGLQVAAKHDRPERSL
jgi:hypothetical protein